MLKQRMNIILFICVRYSYIWCTLLFGNWLFLRIKQILMMSFMPVLLCFKICGDG